MIIFIHHTLNMVAVKTKKIINKKTAVVAVMLNYSSKQ